MIDRGILTLFFFYISTECPLALTDPGDLCQQITAVVTLSVQGPNETSLVDTYEASLFQAIYDGDLEQQLFQVRFDTPVSILTGQENNVRDITPTSDDLSSGARAGIAAAAVVLVLGTIFLVARRKPLDEQKQYAEYHGEEEPSSVKDKSQHSDDKSDSIFTDQALQLSTTTGATTLGAAQADYGKRSASRSAIEAMEAGEDLMQEPALDQYESSSNAGSSGWSSSAGVSSMNTGSIDDSMDAAVAAGATLASMGLASGFRQKDASVQSR